MPQTLWPLLSTGGVYNLWAHGKRFLYTTGAEAENSAVNFSTSVPPLYENQSPSFLPRNAHVFLPTLFLAKNWRVPNPPGANPLVAERASWRSSQSCVTGGQQPIGNPYRFLSFLLHTWQPLCDPNSHSWGRLFPLPGG